MPLSKRLTFLSLSVLLILTALLIYSCKDDSSVVGDTTDDGNTQEAAIKISSPKSGDTLYVSGSYNILWTSNFTDAVNIEFSDDNGVTWTPLEFNIENNGVYMWTPVPDSISAQCRLRVSSADGSVSYTTGSFRIMKASEGVMSLSLTKPNGGEILFPGDSYTIAWKSANVSQVKLEFSSDAGSTWNIIAPNYPADSLYYIWSPIPNLKSSSCIVRLSDVLTGTLVDSSNSAFTIGQPKVIRVLSPNGGEDWAAKSNKTITWYSSEVSSVKIEYSSNNGVDWTSVVDNTPSDGYFIWDPLPNLPTTNAKIRVTNIEEGYPSDASDSVFTVSPEDALTLTSPNGGEQWQSGSSQYIRWNSIKQNLTLPGKKNGKPGTKEKDLRVLQVSSVKLEYTTNSGATWNFIEGDIPNNGSYVWASVPSASSSLCKVRISDMEDDTPFDLSDSTFTIYNTVQQDISVTLPNGGETWNAGTSQSITWSSSGVSSVKIEYTTNNGTVWQTIIDNTPSDGFFNWSHVPNITSTNCKIRISDAEDGFPADMSNAVFEIAPEPEITILSPNGGESLKAGSNSNITWSSTNISDVKIEFTTNNGAAWIPVVESTPSDGLFEWTNIPDFNSSLCRIKISDANDGVPFDISDDNFSIDNKTERSITVTSPNGGEILVGGTHQKITWASLNIDTVKIDLSTNNGASWSTIENIMINTGAYEWLIPDSINSNQCRLRISDYSGLPYDVSNAPFSLTPIPSLTITYPNGGESIAAGTPFMIKWTSSGVAYVRLEYTMDNGFNYFTIVEKTPNSGKYMISLTTPGSQYKIRVKEADTFSPIDESDGTFRISPEPSISVLSPNGGEIWPAGTSQNITWTSTNVKTVGIEYTTNNGASWNSIINSTESDGLYQWSVPSASSSLCKIRIKNAEDTIRTDISDLTFTISQEPLGITVTAPNGNESWEAGTSQNITWSSNGISNVKIEYTINNGVDWTTIAASTPSDGFYQWTPIPNSPSTNCRVRISDVVNNYTDQSNELFSIAPESQINISSPNGGENFQAGTSANITWTSTNIANVKIEFTTDGGASWNLITGNVESKGLYTWENIPDVSSSQCKIKISDANDGTPFDISDENFTITNQVVQSITLISPNGSEAWEAGTSHNITWNSTAVSDVKIDFSTNNGQSWNLIAANVSNTGSYEWSVPNINSTQCKIRVSDNADGTPSDESNSMFSIQLVQSIRVIYPNGGESIISGTPVNITWQSVGIQKVKIEYSLNNGSFDTDWFVLVDSIPAATGSYSSSFSLPENSISRDHFRIRISDAVDNSPIDYCDGTFTVLPPPSITIIRPNGGENWLAGSTYEIQWTSTIIDSVRIEYTLNGGADWNFIADVVSNGLYNWTVPANIQYRSDLCRIRITYLNNGASSTYTDLTDGFFSVHPQSKLVRVIFPNGGEQLFSPDTLIQWTSAGISNVKIEYSVNNGVDWLIIAGSVPSTGAYKWSIPPITSTLTRIRITDVSDPTYTDESDSYFYLNVTESGLFFINPGKPFKSGTDNKIVWLGSDDIKEVNIEYSVDNAKTWQIIAANISQKPKALNQYIWKPVGKLPGNILVKVSDSSGKYKALSRKINISN